MNHLTNCYSVKDVSNFFLSIIGYLFSGTWNIDFSNLVWSILKKEHIKDKFDLF